MQSRNGWKIFVSLGFTYYSLVSNPRLQFKKSQRRGRKEDINYYYVSTSGRGCQGVCDCNTFSFFLFAKPE